MLSDERLSNLESKIYNMVAVYFGYDGNGDIVSQIMGEVEKEFVSVFKELEEVKFRLESLDK